MLGSSDGLMFAACPSLSVLGHGALSTMLLSEALTAKDEP